MPRPSFNPPPPPPRKIAAAALTCAALLLSPLAAAAQAVSVSNLGQASRNFSSFVGYEAISSSFWESAQAFTTGGSSSDRFMLTDVTFNVVGFGDSNDAFLRGRLDVAIHLPGSTNAALPGNAVAQLTGTTPTATGETIYSAPSGGLMLNGASTYFVLWRAPESTNTFLDPGFQIELKNSGNEDAGSAAGWSISNNGAVRSRGSNWISSSSALHAVRVRATVPVPPEIAAARARIAVAEAHALVTVQLADAAEADLATLRPLLATAVTSSLTAQTQLDAKNAELTQLRDTRAMQVDDAVTAMLPARLMQLVDLTGDGTFGQSDFLLHYYAEAMADLLGDGTENSGSAIWRRVLLAPLAGGTAATDTNLRELLTRAGELRATARAAPSP